MPDPTDPTDPTDSIDPTRAVSDKKAGVALAWLGTVGPLGVHRFYLGRWITGALAGGLMAALLWWSFQGVLELFVAEFRGGGAGVDGPTFGNVFTRLGLTVIWGLWPGVDLWLLSTGRMHDSQGRRVER